MCQEERCSATPKNEAVELPDHLIRKNAASSDQDPDKQADQQRSYTAYRDQKIRQHIRAAFCKIDVPIIIIFFCRGKKNLCALFFRFSFFFFSVRSGENVL